MITICTLAIFLGCVFLYSSSKKAILNEGVRWVAWVQSNRKLSVAMGVICLGLGLVMCVPLFGVTAGILYWLFTWSTLLSLIIVLSPLQQLRYYHLLGVLGVLFLIEMMMS